MTNDEFKEYCKMEASWWMNSATNGHCLTRNACHGTGDEKLTDAELVTSAMDIAHNHMTNYRNACDQ